MVKLTESKSCEIIDIKLGSSIISLLDLLKLSIIILKLYLFDISDIFLFTLFEIISILGLEKLLLLIELFKLIDNISFQNMMSLNSLKTENRDPSAVIAEKISLACCEANEMEIEEMEKIVLEMPFKMAMGLLNWINKSLKENALAWEERFLSVHISDKDYEQAGGHRMNQFNVITTIKNTCNDFNVTYKEAWKMSYSVIQTNSYSRATAGHIQQEMERIKEAKMIAKQKQPR